MTLSNLVNQIRLIRSEIVHWLDKPKLLNRLTLYAITFALVIIAFHPIFLHCGFLHTSADSARYMLSALVQVEAAIMAMVLTLSLVAMQLAASSYSPRVMEEFRKTPDLWILIGVYGIAVFYGLVVLKLIEGACPLVDSVSKLEVHILCAYYFGIFAFVALIHYIWNTLNLLKPSMIISILKERIIKENILSDIGEEGRKTIDEDPVQPIVDIVCGAMTRYDYTTIRDGLRAIGDRADHIFKNDKFKDEWEAEKIAKRIFDHLTDVGGIAASRYDEKSAVEVIYNLYKNGETLVKRKCIGATNQAVDSLGMIGVLAVEKKLGKAAKEAAEDIGKIGVFATDYATEIRSRSSIIPDAKGNLKEILERMRKSELERRGMDSIVNSAKGNLKAIRERAQNLGLEDARRKADAGIRLIDEIIEKRRKP